jgi:hypothetical protein
LLELTQRLFSRQAFPLERCPGLGEGSPLLLTGAGAGGIDGAVTAVVMAVVRAATACCGSTTAAVLRGPSLIAVARSRPPATPSTSAASWGRTRLP